MAMPIAAMMYLPVSMFMVLPALVHVLTRTVGGLYRLWLPTCPCGQTGARATGPLDLARIRVECQEPPTRMADLEPEALHSARNDGTELPQVRKTPNEGHTCPSRVCRKARSPRLQA